MLIAIESGNDNGDLSRAIQGVAAGIGFIGAGAILKPTEQEDIQGLTTAATLWLTAAVGVAAGAGKVWLGAVRVICAFGDPDHHGRPRPMAAQKRAGAGLRPAGLSRNLGNWHIDADKCLVSRSRTMCRTRIACLVVLAVLSGLAPPASAQSSLPIAVDQRVRLWTDAADAVTGRVTAVTPATVQAVGG